MHTADLDIAVVDDDKSGEHLADELLYRGDDEDIVFQTEEEDNEGGRNKILKISKLIEMYRKKTTENESGKDADPAKGRNWGLVNFSGVGHIEQLLHFGHINNGWNGKERDGKRNSYRK